MKLSIIIPVYNEQDTVEEVINRVKKIKLPKSIQTEIIVVDDGSTDQTPQILKAIKGVSLIHQKHGGKGMAIQTALKKLTGEYVLTQDADLEYNPDEIVKLVDPIIKNKAEVVYGSRNLRINPRSSLLFFWGGVLLSKLANWLYGSHLTDESTGYKLIKTDLLKSLSLQANGFDFCPEITAKILKSGVKIVEVPISYSPRNFDSGKKIKISDGIIAIWTLLKYKIFNS